MLEDVLVKVDKFIFPVDFVVLNIEKDYMVSLILGKSFLTMVMTLIDVQKGNTILKINDEQITFDVVTPQIRDVTGQRQTYTYASEALTY